jgi:diguanylate cyclase (GGDEF)-like protein/PAS domain S-box-containing protein
VAGLAALTSSLVLLIGLVLPRGPLPAVALVTGVLGLYGWSAFAGRESEARRRLVARLRESQAELKTIIDTSPSAVITADDRGAIVGWNRQAERMFGWSPDEALGRTLAATIVPSRFRRAHERGIARYRQTGEGRLLGKTVEMPARHRDGHEFAVELTVSPGWQEEGHAIVVAFVQDISERKQSERLRKAEYAVTRPLATAASWEQAAPQVIRGICENLGWDLGEFWIVDPEAGVLRWECAWHRGPRGFEEFATVSRDVPFVPGSGLLGRVWATRKPASIADIGSARTDAGDSGLEVESTRAAAAVRAGLRSQFAFPTMNGSTVTGVLALFSREHRTPDRSTLRVMGNLGSQIGQFIERRRAEEALRDSGERIRVILDNVVDGIITLDAEGIIQSCNPPAQKLFGYAPEEIIGKDAAVLVDPAVQAEFTVFLGRWLRSSGKPGTSVPQETVGRRPDGSTFPLECLLSKVKLERGSLHIATLRDISVRKAQSEALEYRALHDLLTGLPNRTFLGDRLEQAILAGEREKKPRALLLLDMDRFKQVNDTLGHASGDRLLQEVALRLRKALRRADTVARWGGDEFAIVPSGTTDVPRAILIAEKLLETLEAPFTVAGQQVDIGASIGIAIYPEHGDDATTLMGRADVAMYVAKQARSGYSLYTGEQESALRPLALVTKLRSAIEQFELVLHYQPIVDLQTGTPLRAEALVRWGHPSHGLIQPNDFIPAAEQSDLIKPLTLWVLNEALTQLNTWRKAGLDLGVTVNLSGRTLLDPEFPDATRQLLETWSISPDLLTFEITERSMLASAEHEALRRLRALGVRLSADDFGTGYASLVHLKQLALDEIKIDRSFVTDMVANHDDAAIVRSTIDLAHSLGMRVVAEGIENPDTWEHLSQLGCDFVQGFYVSRPLPGSELGPWLRAPRCALPVDGSRVVNLAV